MTVLVNDFGDQEQNRAAQNPLGGIGRSAGEWCSDSYRDDCVDAPDTYPPVEGGLPNVVWEGDE